MTAVLAQIAWVSTGLLARIGSGVVTFVLIARVLSPDDFGKFTTLLAVTVLAALPVNLGLVVLTLKQSGLLPGDFAAFLKVSLKVKLGLALAVAIIVSVGYNYFRETGLIIFLILLLAALVESFTEFLYAALRARQFNRLEAVLTLTQACLVMLCMAPIVEIFGTILLISLAYLLPRVLMLIVALIFAHRKFFRGSPSGAFYSARRLLSDSLTNFSELTAQTILVQVDTILLAAAAGTQQVATYQAVMRIVHGFSNLISVFLSVFLPRIIRLQNADDRERLISKVTVLLGGAGLLFSGLLISFAEVIDALLYDGKFEGIQNVIFVAAGLLFARFIAAGFGIGMIARNDSSARLAGILAGLVVLIGLGWPLSSNYGAQGMMFAMFLAYLVILVAALFAARMRR